MFRSPKYSFFVFEEADLWVRIVSSSSVKLVVGVAAPGDLAGSL